MNVRTRFAPSPTGFLHVGNVRAALFPWLIAQQAEGDGKFILRVEDTDQAREVAGAVDIMRRTLFWLGIEWDEGPDTPGKFDPYTQSERVATGIYQKWAEKLIASGRAYADIRTPQELEALRDNAKAQKKAFLARDYRPVSPPIWKPGMPLRFKSDPKPYTWNDAIMGELSAGAEAVDDFIILKSDGFPTYNFAHIVDDYEMQITHVIRGLEYIASVPKYLNLYEALGIPQPILAHAPHIMNEEGNKKLSKRDGAKSVLDYKEQGILPDAMINFLASLGWNDGTEQEVFSVKEIINKFSLERVQRSGARFDERRLLWLNGEHIRRISLEKLYKVVGDTAGAPNFWPSGAFAPGFDDEYRLKVLALAQDRMKFFDELKQLTSFFFTEPTPNWSMIETNKQLKKFERTELLNLLKIAHDELETTEFTTEKLTETLNNLLQKTGQKPAVLFGILRLALTWAPFSPGLAETMNVLGKEKTLARIKILL